MSGRGSSLVALIALGALAVLALVAISATADPDISTPPTSDWFFDSGQTVTISMRTWDINYNITVANLTHLKFDGCKLTVYDAWGLNPLWMNVWWNGTMEFVNCALSSSGSRGYYIIADGNITLTDSSFTGMVQPVGRLGGLSAKACTVTVDGSSFSDITGGPAVYAMNCDLVARSLSVTGSGDTTYAALYVYYNGNPMDRTFTVNLGSCVLSDNMGSGLKIESRLNWADLSISIDGCEVKDNALNGIELRAGYDSSTDATNGTVSAAITAKTDISGNKGLGLYVNLYRWRLDGTAVMNLTIDGCVIENNNDGGIYMRVGDTDADLTVSIADTTFTDDSLNPYNWNAGGLTLDEWSHTGDLTFLVDGAKFDGNGRSGITIYHNGQMGAGSFDVKNSEFTDNMESGVYIYYNRYYSKFAPFSIEGCSFSGHQQAAVYVADWSLNGVGYELTITDCDITGPDGAGILSEAGWEDSGEVKWAIEGCDFTNLEGVAVGFGFYYVQAGASLEMRDCSVDRTGGVRFTVMDSQDIVAAIHNFLLESTDITDTNGAAVEFMAYGYSGVGLTMEVKDVSIANALYSGIRVAASTNYASTSMAIDISVDLTDVSIDDVTGDGLNIGTSLIQYKGTRVLMADGLTINNTEKAVTLSGMRGELRTTKLANTMRQDVTVITSEVDLFATDISGIEEDKFQVIESGSIRFWYSLEVHVVWDTGQRVDNAVVEVMDNHHTLIGVYTQTPAVDIPVLTFNSFQLRETGLFTRSPYLLNVTYQALGKLVTVELDRYRSVTVELADHTPPRIFINEPASGYVQQSLSIKVRGSSFDSESGMDRVNVSIDNIEWFPTDSATSWTYTFNVDIDTVRQSQGAFFIRARAFDKAGNSQETMVIVRVDPFEPELLVEYPPIRTGGFPTNLRTIQVRGVTEAGAFVTVNGVPVPLAGTYWNTAIDLVEGPNTVTVVSADALGNTNSVKFTVVLDTKSPYIVVLSPIEGEMFTTSTVNVAGQAEEGLVISINGVMLDPTQYTAGAFTYAQVLLRGENIITVRAVDPAGNIGRITRTVWLDDVPPALMISEPLDGSYLMTPRFHVTGSTDTDSELTINDERVVLDHGTFRHEIVGVEGDNRVHIVAVDPSGNTVEVTLTVHLDMLPPTMELSTPAQDGTFVRAAEYMVEGVTQGASSVLINGVLVVPDASGAFNASFMLSEGVNRFTIVGSDLAGNTVTLTRTVMLDRLAPILVVKVPGVELDKTGAWVYRTAKDGTPLLFIKGNTDTAIQVLVNGQLIPIGENGYFEYTLALSPKTANQVTVRAIDAAGNEKVWNQTITHQYASAVDDEGFKVGWALLVLGLIILLLAIVIAYMVVSRAGGGVAEPEEEAELAPAPAPELEVEEKVPAKAPEPRPEEKVPEEKAPEAGKGGEEVHEVKAPAPVAARPKTTAPRRPVPAAGKEAPKEVGEEKDLDDEGSEADLGADETDQEGM